MGNMNKPYELFCLITIIRKNAFYRVNAQTRNDINGT